MSWTISTPALIEAIRDQFDSDLFVFQGRVSIFLAGDQHKKRRQEVIYTLTGEKRPTTKCSIIAVTFELNKEFTQGKLF